MFLRRFITLIVALTIAACTSTPAPVVEGWKQPPQASDYRVQNGDSLYSIAWAFALDYRDLARWNNLQPPYPLHTGQVLHMSPPNGTPARTYVVAIPPPARSAPSAAPARSSQLAATPSNAPVVTKPTTPIKHGDWLWPAKGRVVRGFSLTSGGNKGIDIAGKVGEPVMAASDGKVVYAGASLPGYGNLIIIKHSESELSAYAYNKVIAVKEGQVVKAGQTIAQMGKNDQGRAVLHFEVRQNGKPVNPRLFLRGN